MFSRASKNRLTNRDIGRFPDDTLFHRIARAVCGAGCLPRKELYETWEMARRVRRLFRGGRVVDLAGGHGLLAQTMLIADRSSPCAVVVDTALPVSSRRIHVALAHCWPELKGRVDFMEGALEKVELAASDVIVSCHACGTLTDRVLQSAVDARARVAVLPCCHDLASSDTGGLTGWVDGPAAVDIVRAVRLSEQGYRTWTKTIPADITQQNRLLLGAPRNAAAISTRLKELSSSAPVR